MIFNFFLIISFSTIFVFSLSFYLAKRERKRVGRLNNKSLPRNVKINKSVKKYKKEVIKAVDYINNSLGIAVYSLDKGSSSVYFVSRSDIFVPIKGDGYGTIAFSVSSEDFICLTDQLDSVDSHLIFLMIVHELLHDLGFDHQEKSVDSILNEFPVLISKLYSKPLFMSLALQRLPEHDLTLIKKQYF